MKSLPPSEKYEAICELISDKELKFGCEVSIQNFGKWNDCLIEGSGDVFIRCESSGLQGRGAHFSGTIEIKENFYRELPGYKILGTPPDLSRVLLYFMRRPNTHLSPGVPKDTINLWKDCNRSDEYDKSHVYWDLSRSLLRDQDESVISFLYDLLIQK